MNIFKYVLIPFSLILVILILVSSFFTDKSIFSPSNSHTSQENFNNKAPLFDSYIINYDKKFRLIDTLGNVVIIVFWATWSSESIDQLSIVNKYYLSNISSNKNIEVYAIGSGEDRRTLNSLIKRGGYDIPVISDENGLISRKFNVNTLPSVILIDKAGIIQKRYSSIINLKEIGDNVESFIQD